MKNARLNVWEKSNIPKYPESPNNQNNLKINLKSSGIQNCVEFKEMVSKPLISTSKSINLANRGFFTPKVDKMNKPLTTINVTTNKNSTLVSNIQNKTHRIIDKDKEKKNEYSRTRTLTQTIDYLETSVNRKNTSRVKVANNLKESSVENIFLKKLEKTLHKNRYTRQIMQSIDHDKSKNTSISNKNITLYSSKNFNNKSSIKKDKSGSRVVSGNSNGKRNHSINSYANKDSIKNVIKKNTTSNIRLSMLDSINTTKDKPKLSVDVDSFHITKATIPFSTTNINKLNNNSNINSSNSIITPNNNNFNKNKQNFNNSISKISSFKKYVPLNLKLINKVQAIENSIANIRDIKIESKNLKEIRHSKQIEVRNDKQQQIIKEKESSVITNTNKNLVSRSNSNSNDLIKRAVNINLRNINKLHNAKTKNKSVTISTGNSPKSIPISLNTISEINKSKSFKEKYLKNKPKSSSKSASIAIGISSNLESAKSNNCIIEKEEVLTKFSKILDTNEIEELKLIDEIFYLGLLGSQIQFDTIERENSQCHNASPFYFSRAPSNIEQGKNNPYNGDNLNISINKTNYNLPNCAQLNEQKNKYDDQNGNYKIKLGDHIKYRYEIISELGRGSFGQAIKCYDHKTKERVCVKIIKNRKKFDKQAKIEITILEYIKNNDKYNPMKESNIVEILDHFNFRNHICIVFELLDINLYELIKSQYFKGFEPTIIRKLSIQILQTLIYLQKHKIIHCDLKPENILLKQYGKSAIKVIDFGSSCFATEKLYTYIQSRFYRAPEIILGLGYGIEIDMWSFGCILAELFSGIPIFPGQSERDQLGFFMEYLGVPPQNLIELSKKRSHFFDENFFPILIPNSRGKIRQPNTKNLCKFLQGCEDNFLDLVKKCLEWNPEKRIKPDEAMLHPWISIGLTKDLVAIHKNKIKLQNSNSVTSSNKSLSNNPVASTTGTNKTEENYKINFNKDDKNNNFFGSFNNNQNNNLKINQIDKNNSRDENPHNLIYQNEKFQSRSKIIKMKSEDKNINSKVKVTFDYNIKIDGKDKTINPTNNDINSTNSNSKHKFSFN